MGILGNIFPKIFPSSHPAVAQADAPAASDAANAAPGSATSTPVATQNIPEVDVEQILNGMEHRACMRLHGHAVLRAQHREIKRRHDGRERG